MGFRRFLDSLIGLNNAQPPAATEMQRWQTALTQGTRQRRAGNYTEALATFEEVLVQARAAGNPVAEATALGHIGALHTQLRQWDAAVEVLEEAVRIAREQDNVMLRAAVLNDQAAYFAARNEHAAAQERFEEALTYARQGSDPNLIAHILAELAGIYMAAQNSSYAQRLLEEANELTRFQTPAYVGRLGEALLDNGREADGHRYIVQALRVAHAMGNHDQECMWAISLGSRYAESGKVHEADRLFQRVAALVRGGVRLNDDDNLRYVLERANVSVQLGRHEEAVRLLEEALPLAENLGRAADLARVHGMLGRVYEALEKLDQAVGHMQTALGYLPADVPSTERVNMQLELARIQQEVSPESSVAAYREIVDAARKSGDHEPLANALMYLGRVEHASGQEQGALEHWRQAANLFQELGDAQHLAPLLCDLANLLKDRGDRKQALNLYEQALVELNNIKHPPTRGLVLSNVANMYTDTGDVETAQAFFEEAIAIARDSGDRTAESLRLGNLGWFLLLTGQTRTAITTIEKALAISDKLDAPLMQAVQRDNLALAYARLGDYGAAERLHQQALKSIEDQDEPRWLGMFCGNYGETLARQSKYAEAQECYERALELSRSVEDNSNVVRTLRRLADLQRQTNDLEAAEANYEKAAHHAQAIGAQRELALTYLGHGLLAQTRHAAEKARQLLNEADRLLSILHAPERDQAVQALKKLT